MAILDNTIVNGNGVVNGGLNINGTLIANAIKKLNGTSSQYLRADGSTGSVPDLKLTFVASVQSVTQASSVITDKWRYHLLIPYGTPSGLFLSTSSDINTDSNIVYNSTFPVVIYNRSEIRVCNVTTNGIQRLDRSFSYIYACLVYLIG